jgi:CHASE2 domain-containing sensor protein
LISVFVGRLVVNVASVIRKFCSKSALIGAALAVLCGLLLWGTPLGDAWENASYDLQFRFGSRVITNEVVLLHMDNESYSYFQLDRSNYWDRAIHTELLNKLTADGCRLVVFDVLFKSTNNPAVDAKLAEAMRQNGHVVLMADVSDENRLQLNSARVVQPHEFFLKAAASWGVGRVDTETGGIARHHWPFLNPGEGDIHSLGWAAAIVAGANLDSTIGGQWLRYYGKNGPGTVLPYYQALQQKPGFFKDKIVFIGGWPGKPNDPGYKESLNDKFRTPFTQQTGKAIGGMEIMATTFLNLVNGDWLRRAPEWLEALLLVVTGILLGGGLCQLKPLPSLLVAIGIGLVVMIVCVALSYSGNYWFPWLVISGGQVPCALAWAWVARTRQHAVFTERFPGYTPEGEPFGEGAYGRVWLVRNVLGHRQALKEIKRSHFHDDDPYDREFRGIQNYKPISHLHLGLLQIDHVNRNDLDGYFYYVMELGDAMITDWDQKGCSYQAWNLHNVCLNANDMRLPVGDCLRIGIALADGLDFLHQHGLVHRDIKPSNVIFVKGCPKLADIGLVRPFSPDASQVGTLSFMPPEGPGRPPADIFALGKLLYVISTGKKAEFFSEISRSLVETAGFVRLNEIICKACQPAVDQRYATVAEMLAALRAAQKEFEADSTKKI